MRNRLIKVSVRPYNERKIPFLVETLTKIVDKYNTLEVYAKTKFDRIDEYTLLHILNALESKNVWYDGGKVRNGYDDDYPYENTKVVYQYLRLNDSIPNIYLECEDEDWVVIIDDNRERFEYTMYEIEDLLKVSFVPIEE